MIIALIGMAGAGKSLWASRLEAAGFTWLQCDDPTLNLGTAVHESLHIFDAKLSQQATTIAPAQAVRRPQLGTLKAGAPADASVLAVDGGRFEYLDVDGESMIGDRRITARGAVVSGTWWDPLQEGGNRAGQVEDGSASSLAS